MIEIALPHEDNEPEKVLLTPNDLDNIRAGRKIPTLEEAEHPEALAAVIEYLENHADDAKKEAMKPEVSRYLNFLENRGKMDDLQLESITTRLQKYRWPVTAEGAGIIAASTLAGRPIVSLLVLACVAVLRHLPAKAKQLHSKNAKTYEALRKRLILALTPSQQREQRSERNS
jgi:hypothetical protein